VPDDWAVVSLCRIDDTMRRPTRRETYLIDQPGDHNPALARVIDDALDSIEQFRRDGLPVVVHCYAGKSRTGLIATSWLMRRGHTLADAQATLRRIWPVAHFDNPSFLAELHRRDALPRPRTAPSTPLRSEAP
jgi:ADP-ribosyl-[dinitrogen reductase] hydrolase